MKHNDKYFYRSISKRNKKAKTTSPLVSSQDEISSSFKVLKMLVKSLFLN